MTNPQDKVRGLSEAAQELLDKLRLVHDDPRYKAVWEIAHFRLGPYDGPKYESEMLALNHALYREIVPDTDAALGFIRDRLSTQPASPSSPSPEEREALSDLRTWCTHSPETESLVGPSPVRKHVLELVEMFERRFGGAAQPTEPSAGAVKIAFIDGGIWAEQFGAWNEGPSSRDLKEALQKRATQYVLDVGATHPIAPVGESELARIIVGPCDALPHRSSARLEDLQERRWAIASNVEKATALHAARAILARYGSRLVQELTSLQRKEITNAVGTLESHGQGDSAKLIRERMLGEEK